MPAPLKLVFKCLIGWFLLVSGLFVAHFATNPARWPELGRLLLGLGGTLCILLTAAGFLATCVWVVSQFRLFDDEYWY
jgi:uncharacterized membrane protein HdeD (DUF308 family)